MSHGFSATTTIPGAKLTVPRVTIGTMMFGGRADEAESMRVVDAALERGFNFFDVATQYQGGESERLLGKAVAGRRDRFVIASKVGYGLGPDGKEEGTSREAILRAIDQSLSRLAIDAVDIYYLHRPDADTPIEETLEAMDAVVRAGKARHFGISNFGGWQSLEVLNLCDANGWARPVISQMIYNPLVRQIEYEYIAFARKHGLYLTIYNPLAGGLLTGKYAGLDDEGSGGRFVDMANYRQRYWSKRMFDGMLGLKTIADDEGRSLTHLTLAWVAGRDGIDNILLGPSNTEQLLDCLAADDCEISEEGMKRIDAFLDEFDGTDATYAR